MEETEHKLQMQDDKGISTSCDSSDSEEEEEIEISNEHSKIDMKRLINLFSCSHRDIIAEFANVETFLVSLDSLIIECTAHSYYKSTFFGQTTVLNAQIARFLEQFRRISENVKLVIFSKLSLLFKRDPDLDFLRTVAIAHLRQGPYKNDIETFSSPLDPRWSEFLQKTTPSLFMISTDSPLNKTNFTPQLQTIMLDALTNRALPVVPLSRLVINFTKVNAFYIEPMVVKWPGQERFFELFWKMKEDEDEEESRKGKEPSVIPAFSLSFEIWLQCVQETSERLTGEKRNLASTISLMVEWCACSSKQSKMAPRLLTTRQAKSAPLDLPWMYQLDSKLLREFVPESQMMTSKNQLQHQTNIEKELKETRKWQFKQIEEDFEKAPEKITNKWQLKRINRSRQKLSQWHESFANSLEGRVTNLLVDFSRTPAFAGKESNPNTESQPLKAKGWPGQKAGGGGKKNKSKEKPEQIREKNAKEKEKKLLDDERIRIEHYAEGQNAIAALEKALSELRTQEMKALCNYKIVKQAAKELLANTEATRRRKAITIVSHLKYAFNEHWEQMNEKQQTEMVNIWVSLGFDPPKGKIVTEEAGTKKLDLGMNMIYYQLEYAGELIDIQSDPQKDDRVTGFYPDAWQRKMLDIVDKNESALIVAPTSAGKTFVSYYCIEKMLRASDDDVVIYISPSKPLLNQVCGSLYARFRNKTMKPGKALFGTLTSEYGTDVLNCQVLVTVPERLEAILLSTNPDVQQFAAKIKYVIFDEVHSIGASHEAPIWEHLLLLIQCPFLALSATIGNVNLLHKWLQSKTKAQANVHLIEYDERYSELEVAIKKIRKPESGKLKLEAYQKGNESSILPMMPYAMFMLDKIRRFGIPEDSQLTARQIIDFYHFAAQVDAKTKDELEPCKFFGYSPGKLVWISRSELRRFENELKKRFIDWLEHDEEKVISILERFRHPIREQLNARSFPFFQRKVVLETIVSLVEELQDEEMLPAICFNEDRFICEDLAKILCDVLEARQDDFEKSDEYKAKYQIKDEEKLSKLAKRKRDDNAKKRKKNDEIKEDQREEIDPLAAQKSKLDAMLSRFRLRARPNADKDIYDKVIERMLQRGQDRPTTQILLRLFERGIGYHHAGLSAVERGGVEVLFRSGHLAIIFSTSTLALGINMPCKTVIFGMDNPLMTPLLYRQMSGRAGRRGFDHSGTVIFVAYSTGKICRLLTASLTKISGNPPFTCTYLLRLLAFAQQDTGKAKIVLSLLRNPLALYTGDMKKETLQQQLRMYTFFGVQLLRHLQLIDDQGNACGLFQLASLLHEFEPGNLFFIHLLQNGIFHTLCETLKGDELKDELIVVLANLFTRTYLPISFDIKESECKTMSKNELSQIALVSLSEPVQKEIDQLNTKAHELYKRLLSMVNPEKTLLDEPFLLTGNEKNEKENAFCPESLVSPYFSGFLRDESFLPTLDLTPKDHRGKRYYLNAYAIDFWRHGSRKALIRENGLHPNHVWYRLNAFKSVLEKIAFGLESLAGCCDPFVEVMKSISDDYDIKFRVAFDMRLKSSY
ncbi:unnamed protein product, partial [Mesorhabditis belari]|uniref:Uncharacterized protein n=1 Tax=Mesorhabditis belari TaxID=2138241 RepID=A0AAF3EG95_9BILA